MGGKADIALQVLRLFREPDTEAWDLHAFFEFTGGDEPERRAEVLDVVEALAAKGYLNSRGSDFYTLTGKGAAAARQGKTGPDLAELEAGIHDEKPDYR
jgi:hypothetical protein